MNEGFGYLLSICMYSEYLSFVFLPQIYPPHAFSFLGAEKCGYYFFDLRI